ncbi:14-3-3-like protein [Sparassis latifolia]
MNVTLSRLDSLYLAKVADQAERYHDVIAQLKTVISANDAQLTVDERNLLSIAYKNITSSHRGSWRTIDTLQKHARGGLAKHVALMLVEKERIEQDLADICRDAVDLLEQILIPAANSGEEKVFYCKMKGDYYRYLAEISHQELHEQYSASSLEAYKSAYGHALGTLEPVHPTRLGLALNFAVYYHDIVESPERACFIAKHAFDEAIAVASDPSYSGPSLEDTLVILQLLRDDLLLWSGEISTE